MDISAHYLKGICLGNIFGSRIHKTRSQVLSEHVGYPKAF